MPVIINFNFKKWEEEEKMETEEEIDIETEVIGGIVMEVDLSLRKEDLKMMTFVTIAARLDTGNIINSYLMFFVLKGLRGLMSENFRRFS